MTTVAISRDDDIDAAVRQALAPLDVRPLIAGKRVAIKPNDTWASEQDITAATQGDTLRAVIRLVKDYEPGSITVSGGGGAAETDAVFRLTGMMRAIEEEGVAQPPAAHGGAPALRTAALRAGQPTHPGV